MGDFDINVRDAELERALAEHHAHGVHPIAILMHKDEYELIQSTEGLIPMPVVVSTSQGMMRYYRKPLDGEVMDTSEAP